MTLAFTQRIRRSTSDRLFQLLRKVDAITTAGARALQNRAIRAELKRRTLEPPPQPIIYTHCPFCGYPLLVHFTELHNARTCRQCRAGFAPEQHVEPDHKSGRLHPATRPVTRRSLLSARVQQKRRTIAEQENRVLAQ